MSLFRRLRNLWALSRFEITRFDNQLVITRQNDELVFAKPQMAQIIKREPSLDELDNILHGDQTVR